jgi:type I restriction enzyme, S subunit
VSCLEPLPTGWQFVTVEEIATDFRYGTSSKTSVENRGVPVLRMGNISSLGEITFHDLKYLPEAHPDLAETLLREGDLLFNRTNSFELVGKSGVYNGSPTPCSFASYLIRVRLGPRCLPKFLAFALNSEMGRSWIKAVVSQQVGQANVNGTKLRAFRFPLPPIEAQHRIVAEIEKQFTRIDAGVAALRQTRNKLGRYRLAAFESAFACCTGVARIRLGELGEVVGGLTKGQKRKPGTKIREVPYLRVANVQRGYLDLSEVKSIGATEAEIDALRLRPGDILLNEGGDRDKLGRGWLWEGQLQECIHQNHVFRVRLDHSIALPKFVSHYANHFGQKYFVTEGRQTTNLASISISKLRNLPVPIPGVSEQREVLARLEDHLSLIEDLDRTLTLALVRSTRLRQSILHRAFQGRLQTEPGAVERQHEVEALAT